MTSGRVTHPRRLRANSRIAGRQSGRNPNGKRVGIGLSASMAMHYQNGMRNAMEFRKLAYHLAQIAILKVGM